MYVCAWRDKYFENK